MARVVHFEIHADNPERASAFYRSLFSWTITTWDGPMPYWLVVTGPDGTPGINGGIMQRMHPVSGNDGVIAYVCTVQVENLDKDVEKASRWELRLGFPKCLFLGLAG